MPRYAFEIEYDGSAFHGTAPQPGRRTLHGALREILGELDGGEVLTRSSGRLDAGVSALGLVVHAQLARERDPLELARAITGRFERHAAVTRAARVADDWDAMRSAVGKTYAYRVLERGAPPVLERRVLWRKRIARPELLQACADLVTGERDLSAFACLRGDESDLADPVRRIRSARWEAASWQHGTLWTFRISGDGFLYKQVRGLAGAMLAVAGTQASLADFEAAIAAGRAGSRVGEVAPPRGLVLERVHYRPEPDWLVV